MCVEVCVQIPLYKRYGNWCAYAFFMRFAGGKKEKLLLNNTKAENI